MDWVAHKNLGSKKNNNKHRHIAIFENKQTRNKKNSCIFSANLGSEQNKGDLRV